MNLGNIFQPKNQNIKNTSTGKIVSNSSAERAARVQTEIRGYTPGQKIQGEIVGKDGNTVQIALDKDMVIAARLERDLNIALGQNMSFEVKSNNGSLLSLTPLYANMANEATILKALSAAGLAQTTENIQMVSLMMQEGMSIDRDSIAQVSRQLLDFPQANPESVVRMLHLGLPITEINLQQFEQYENYNHQMLQSVNTIMDELPQIGLSLLGEEQDMQAAVFLRQLMQLFAGSEGQTEEQITGQTEGQITEQVEGQTAGQLEGQVTGQIKEQAEGAINSLPEAEVQSSGLQNAVTIEQGTMDGQVLLMPKQPAENEEPLLLSGQETESGKMQQGIDLLKGLEADGKMTKEMLSDLERILQGDFDSISKESTRELLKEVFGSKTFQNLLKENVANQWLLNPAEVADKEKVEQLYERIRQQSTRLNEVLQSAGKADTAVGRSVQNLQSNVDFMNQMNQLFTYVQLPLKMAGNQAHGDLYVYTNKKNLAKKDGSVSALLHLDMEHLGALDVYVTMKQGKVNTNFTVQDESILDLLEAHMYILTERLEKRGYSMNASFQIKEAGKETNIMKEILEQNKNISVLSSTSFDMRA